MKAATKKLAIGLGKWMLKVGGYYKDSPNGSYPGHYSQGIYQDARQQLSNAKAHYELAKENQAQENELSVEQINKMIFDRCLASIAWFVCGAAAVVLFPGGYNVDGLAIPGLMKFVAVSALYVFGFIQTLQVARLIMLARKAKGGL